MKNGLVAVAVEGATGQSPGAVQFFDAATGAANGPAVTVGAMPDMLAFTPNGLQVLTANEGEADLATGLINPEGSVSIVDVATRTATTASFVPWNGQKAALKALGVRISDRNGVTLAQDLEPEYLTIDAASTTAWVTMQEANAIAVVDIATATVTSIHPLGVKDHALPGNEFDPSNNDNIVGNFQNFPVLGLYMPDAICSFTIGGVTYLATANEGDSRADFAGWEKAHGRIPRGAIRWRGRCRGDGVAPAGGDHGPVDGSRGGRPVEALPGRGVRPVQVRPAPAPPARPRARGHPHRPARPARLRRPVEDRGRPARRQRPPSARTGAAAPHGPAPGGGFKHLRVDRLLGGQPPAGDLPADRDGR